MITSKRADDKDFTHYRVLKLLKENPDLSQREMAQRLGISNGGMHYCLNALMEKGMIKLENFANSKHKFGYFYLLTSKGIAQKAALTGLFLERKMAEYEALRKEIEALKLDAEPQVKG